MFRRVYSILMGAAAVAFLALTPGTASAHYLAIVASASCVQGSPVISYTVTSYDVVDFAGSNPTVDVLFNGVTVDSQAFSLATNPKNQFSGQKAAPSSSTVTVEAIASGVWGDGVAGGQSTTTTVDLPTNCVPAVGTGRFTGGGRQIDVNGVSITKGLTIHCDLLLSNNLEINWRGHQFHMLQHLSAICTDDPLIIQAPPKAPLDTMVGVGIGRYDGMDGYTVQFTLVDAGEPGTNDKAAFKIFETANPSNVVLDLPLTVLTGGNLQAHYDQPHK